MNKSTPTDIAILGSTVLVKFDSRKTKVRYSGEKSRKIPTLELFEFLDIKIDMVYSNSKQISEDKIYRYYGGGSRDPSRGPSQYNSYKSYGNLKN